MKRKQKKALTALLLVLLIAGCRFIFSGTPTEKEAVPKQPENTSPAKETTARKAPDDTMELHFIDVGQGDCILVHTNENNILVDAGNPSDGADIGEYLHSLGIDRIDTFIGTHPHADHLGGGAYIVREFDIGEMIMTDQMSGSFFFEKLLDSITERNVPVSLPQIGGVRKFGSVSMEIISPSRDYGNLNDSSIVMRIDHGEASALLTGDAETSVEEDLLSEDAPLDADVLKAGHHGSRYASSEEFLKAVSPEIVVIQSGEGNSYGHPHSEALDRFENCGAKVYRCDKEGTIVLRSDGKTFKRVGAGAE